MFEERYPGIYVYENFLTESEISALRASLDNFEQNNDLERTTKNIIKAKAKERYPNNTAAQLDYVSSALHGSSKLFGYLCSLPLSENNFLNSIIKKLNLYDCSDRIDDSHFSLVKIQKDGMRLGQHYDNEYNSSIACAVNFYINDDYEGGELYFSNQKIKFKPKSNSLVIFPGTIDYTHEVLPISGNMSRFNVTHTSVKPISHFLSLNPDWL